MLSDVMDTAWPSVPKNFWKRGKTSLKNNITITWSPYEQERCLLRVGWEFSPRPGRADVRQSPFSKVFFFFLSDPASNRHTPRQTTPQRNGHRAKTHRPTCSFTNTLWKQNNEDLNQKQAVTYQQKTQSTNEPRMQHAWYIHDKIQHQSLLYFLKETHAPTLRPLWQQIWPISPGSLTLSRSPMTRKLDTSDWQILWCVLSYLSRLCCDHV